jgi:hypothetical protein
LSPDFAALSTKKREVKGKCKYQRVTQEKKRKQKKKSEVLAFFVSSILQYMPF